MTFQPGKDISTASLPFKPRSYQQRAINFMLERGAAGLFLDPGMGKTAITLAAYDVLREEGLVRSMLVVAPLRVCYQVWPREITKWKDFQHLTSIVLHGDKKEELWQEDACVFIINPSGLRWLSTKFPQKLTAKNRGNYQWFDMLVVDESTLFKHGNTDQFKFLKQLLPLFTRRYILTGTPVPNGLMDLFYQIWILDGGAALGRYITQYRKTYFYADPWKPYDWQLFSGAEQKIYQRVRPLTLRMENQEFKELPTVLPVWVDLPPKAMATYKRLEKEFIVLLEEGKVTASNAGVLTSKLRQLANGGVYLDDNPEEAEDRKQPRRVQQVHTVKAEAVAEILAELGGKPALVAYEFHHDLARLRKVFGKNTPYVGGGVPAAESQRLEDRWNRGELPVLLAHPAAMSHGLNLQEGGRAVIWHSLTYNLEHHEQLIRRIHRPGVKAPVLVYAITARGTVDHAILAAIGRKGKVQASFLNALQSHYLRRGSRR